MDKLKILLFLLVLALAIVGAFSLFGLIAVVFKWLIWIGLIALVVGVGVKLLKKGEKPSRAQLGDPNFELDRADRLLEEIRAKQLLK